MTWGDNASHTFKFPKGSPGGVVGDGVVHRLAAVKQMERLKEQGQKPGMIGE